MDNERLDWHLWNWRVWNFHSNDERDNGYPARACGGVVRGAGQDFDGELATLDIRAAEAVQAIVWHDLPPVQRAAMLHVHLDAEAVFVFVRATMPLELAYGLARTAVRVGLERRCIP